MGTNCELKNWRQGSVPGETDMVFDAHGLLVATCDSPEVAALIVESVNAEVRKAVLR